MLEVEGLAAGYGAIPVLFGVSFELAEGGVTAVLGHNGMGKTTLLKALIGLLPAQGGRVRLAGADITAWPPDRRARQGMGYVPQGREIFAGLSVRDNLRFAAAARGLGPAAIEPALAAFPPLRPLLARPGGALSGGEQQLLALARCLVQQPRLLLLDEPTEGLQPSMVQEIVATLAGLRQAHRLTILLVEQNLEVAKALADRVLILQKGQIRRALQPAELNDPAMRATLLGGA
jgi:urea ABC transporter ATP-binding protein UrtE